MAGSARILVAALGIGLLTATIPSRLHAQVFEVGGGNSSLYQAGGGSVTVHTASGDITFGAGTVAGHFLEGGQMRRAVSHGTYIAGDDRIDFRLPTDIFDGGHFVLLRGVGFSGVFYGTDIVAFGGLTSEDLDSPFFIGAHASQAAGLLFLKKNLSRTWQLSSDTLLSSKPTQIVALRWDPASRFEVSLAAGWGAGKPFSAATLRFQTPRFDLDAAIIESGQQFQRAAMLSPQTTESRGANISITARPLSFISLSGSHLNYGVPQTTQASEFAHSSINQGSASVHVLGAQINASVYNSTYTQQGISPESNHAVALSALRDFGSRYHLTTNYLVSKPRDSPSTSTFIASLSETINSHLSVTQNLTDSNGSKSINFGGEVLSNVFTLNASYETYYVPEQNAHPFEQALLLDLKFKLLGRLDLHGTTFVDPTGHLRYTADAHTFLAHDREVAPKPQVSLGRFVVHGCVVDSEGSSVEGAAVLIDEKPVYTDSSGCFYIRENQAQTHRFAVILTEFLANGNWQVVSAPATITSTTDDQNISRVVVIVRKVRVISRNQQESPSTASFIKVSDGSLR